MRLDLSALIPIVLALVSAALSYGGGMVRDGYQERDIERLEKALDAERAERLAYQAAQAQARMAWLLQRSDRRLDQNLKDVASVGGQRTP